MLNLYHVISLELGDIIPHFVGKTFLAADRFLKMRDVASIRMSYAQQ